MYTVMYNVHFYSGGCTWLPGTRPECDPNRRSCSSIELPSTKPKCLCQPYWYTEGSCRSEDEPPILPTSECRPTLPCNNLDILVKISVFYVQCGII